MSKPIISRALLLEQLESRCLLAAGVFEQSTTLASHSCDRATTENRSAHSAAIAGQTDASAQHLQRRFDPRQDAQRHQSRDSSQPTHTLIPQPASDPMRNDPLRPVVALRQPKPADPPMQFAFVFRPAITTGVSASDNGPPPIGSNSRPGRDLMLGNSTVLPPAATIATENVQEQSALERTSLQGESAPVDVIVNNDSATQVFSIESPRFEQLNRPLETSAHTMDQNREILGGLIDSLPTLQHEFKEGTASPAEKPWGLDHAALQELRSAANDTNTEILENRHAVDLAIANWFGNSTGLIDDIQCENQLPSSLQELTPSIVDVVLDATVGLHRSVGLIASGDIQPQQNSVRDTILAAIAAEHVSLSAPLLEQTPARLPSIAYSGAAIVVSSLAMAGRYRRKSKLESSR